MDRQNERILVVDDDPSVLRTVEASLVRGGYEVVLAAGAQPALAWTRVHGLPHLAIIDLLLPDGHGLELAAALRAGNDMPVVLLTAIDDEATVVAALEGVAEDYVVKPFRPAELCARVERILRRIGDRSHALERPVEMGDGLKLDLPRRRLLRDGVATPLTPLEGKLLHLLVRNRPRSVPVEQILRRLWPLEEIHQDTLRVHVHRLRQKVERDPGEPRVLLTERGFGYRLVPVDGMVEGNEP